MEKIRFALKQLQIREKYEGLTLEDLARKVELSLILREFEARQAA